MYIQKRNDESFIIKNATIEVLLNKCWLNVEFPDNIFIRNKYTQFKSLAGSIIFSNKYFLPLAERILLEMQNGDRIPEWDKQVMRIFLTYGIASKRQKSRCSVTEGASNSEKL